MMLVPSSARSRRPASLLALGLSCSCVGILGIEDAICDPNLDPTCAGMAPAPGGGGSTGAGSGGTGGGVSPDAGGSTSTSVGGSAGSAGSGAAGSSGAASLPDVPLCDRYCAAVQANCDDANKQFASLEACAAVCATLDAGTPGVLGNTVECRLARANLAGTTGEVSEYCHSAGPGGAGVCGSDCEGFCSVMTPTCGDAPEVGANFADRRACLSACGEVPDLSGPPDNLLYNITIQTGDSIQCRLYHVTAATLDATTHCRHAAGLANCVP
jgi:hypothetical protein